MGTLLQLATFFWPKVNGVQRAPRLLVWYILLPYGIAWYFFLIVFIATACDPVAFAASAAYASRQNYRTICSVIGFTMIGVWS